MDSIKKDGKTWYNLADFMSVYKIKSHRTVYMMLEDERAVKSKFMGRTIYAKNEENQISK